MSTPTVIHVLTGCTAVGKTDLALRWAEARGAEIVSCDSLLFYRGMDIGTAKPTRDELQRVPHHLIDICAPAEAMDIARYVAMARETVAAIVRRGRSVLATGGSGFYLKAFLAPVIDAVEVTPEVRARVAGLTPGEALEALRRLNPSGLDHLDTANPRRVARALERCLATGRTLAEVRAEFARQPSAFAEYGVKLVELTRPADELNDRIGRRVKAMMAAGLVAEVEGLLTAGLRDNASAASAIGYREVIAMLEGRLAPESLETEIAKNTRALVKKQRTWFRTQLPPHAMRPAATTPAEELFAD